MDKKHVRTKSKYRKKKNNLFRGGADLTTLRNVVLMLLAGGLAGLGYKEIRRKNRPQYSPHSDDSDDEIQKGDVFWWYPSGPIMKILAGITKGCKPPFIAMITQVEANGGSGADDRYSIKYWLSQHRCSKDSELKKKMTLRGVANVPLTELKTCTQVDFDDFLQMVNQTDYAYAGEREFDSARIGRLTGGSKKRRKTTRRKSTIKRKYKKNKTKS
jgi:hypothetical protein